MPHVMVTHSLILESTSREPSMLLIIRLVVLAITGFDLLDD